MTPSTIATITTSGDAPIPPTIIPSIILENLPTFNSAFRFDERLRSLETSFSEYRQTNPFVDAVSAIPGIVHHYMTQQMMEAVREALSISEEERIHEEEEEDELYRDVDINQLRGLQVSQDIEDSHVTLTSVHPDGQQESSSVSSFVTSMLNPISDAVAADLSKMELKKILIEKMEGNKSIQRSDEQRNVYKALVDAYEADKTILESYGDTTILKRRREDDDDQEGPSAGSDRGSKRQREGGEPESGSTSSELATRSASMSTTGTQSRQMSASESAFAEEPVQTTCQIDEPSHSMFETDIPIDFSNFIMNRLRVDTLTPDLLAGPTYELMRRSCNSLTKLEYHLEEVYKAMMDQLDWVNPEGQQYPHNLL
nr:hypothetical protein [Tanacetum cinerariifolium]